MYLHTTKIIPLNVHDLYIKGEIFLLINNYKRNGTTTTNGRIIVPNK